MTSVLLINKLTEEIYQKILNTGMFFEFYPFLSGNFEEDRYKLQCKNYKRYKGKRVPKCNNNKPCYSCQMKYGLELHNKYVNHIIQNKND